VEAVVGSLGDEASHDARCRVCACAALVLCAVYMHWGRPPAELRAGVRWAKLARRFGCVGAVRRKRPVGAPLLGAAGRRLGAGGRGRGGEGGLTDFYPPGCYLFRRDGMSRQLFLTGGRVRGSYFQLVY
jgi:hypothetical protein